MIRYLLVVVTFFIFADVFLKSDLLASEDQNAKCLVSTSQNQGKDKAEAARKMNSLSVLQGQMISFLNGPYIPNTGDNLSGKPNFYNLFFQSTVLGLTKSFFRIISQNTRKNLNHRLKDDVKALVNGGYYLHFGPPFVEKDTFLSKGAAVGMPRFKVRKIDQKIIQDFYENRRQVLLTKSEFRQENEEFLFHLGLESLDNEVDLAPGVSLAEFIKLSFSYDREALKNRDHLALIVASHVLAEKFKPFVQNYLNRDRLSSEQELVMQRQFKEGFVERFMDALKRKKGGIAAQKKLLKKAVQFESLVNNETFISKPEKKRIELERVKFSFAEINRGDWGWLTDIIFLEGSFSGAGWEPSVQAAKVFESINKEIKELFQNDMDSLFPVSVSQLVSDSANTIEEQYSSVFSVLRSVVNQAIDAYNETRHRKDVTLQVKELMPVQELPSGRASSTQKGKKNKKKKNKTSSSSNDEVLPLVDLSGLSEVKAAENAKVFFSGQADSIMSSSGKKNIDLKKVVHEEVIGEISQDPESAGSIKFSLPHSIRVYKFRVNGTQYRMALTYHKDKNELEILAIGPRDSFYREDYFHNLKKR